MGEGNTSASGLAAELDRAGVPGAALAVVDRAGEVSTTVFGHADVAGQDAVRPDTVFHLFSATKLYTAAAVVLLAEQGRLGLDDPVADHLDGLDLAHPVTIRQLLTHTSGLPDTLKAFVAVHLADDRVPSTAEALARYRLDKGKPPGTEVAYRNVNFALLGEVISVVSGRPYEAFVTSELLTPLGSGAEFAYTDDQRARAATGRAALGSGRGLGRDRLDRRHGPRVEGGGGRRHALLEPRRRWPGLRHRDAALPRRRPRRGPADEPHPQAGAQPPGPRRRGGDPPPPGRLDSPDPATNRRSRCPPTRPRPSSTTTWPPSTATTWTT